MKRLTKPAQRAYRAATMDASCLDMNLLSPTASQAPAWHPGVPVIWYFRIAANRPLSNVIGRIVRITKKRVTIRICDESRRIWLLRSVTRGNLDAITPRLLSKLERTEAKYPPPAQFLHAGNRMPRQ